MKTHLDVFNFTGESDSFGQEFILRIPGNDSYNKACKIYVTMPTSETSVAVWRKTLTESAGVIPGLTEQDFVRVYDCLDFKDSVLYLYSSADINVNVFLATDNVEYSSFVVYPVDTHATEFQGSVFSRNENCYPVSVHHNVLGVAYNRKTARIKIYSNQNINYGYSFPIDNNFITSSKVVTEGLLIKFNKPSAMFCYNDGRFAVHQQLPLSTWANEYLIPHQILQATYISTATVKIFTTTDNTKVTLIDSIRNETLSIKERGETYEHTFNSSNSPYKVQSDHPVGVGLNFNLNNKYFLMLPPVSSYLNDYFATIPTRIIREVFDFSTIQTFIVRGDGGTSIHKTFTAEETDSDFVLDYNRNSSGPIYGFNVAVDDNGNILFVLPGYTAINPMVTIGCCVALQTIKV